MATVWRERKCARTIWLCRYSELRGIPLVSNDVPVHCCEKRIRSAVLCRTLPCKLKANAEFRERFVCTGEQWHAHCDRPQCAEGLWHAERCFRNSIRLSARAVLNRYRRKRFEYCREM